MYWQMFDSSDATRACMRLHLLAEAGDPGAGPGTSLGYVEQTVRKDPWNHGGRSDATFVAHSNTAHIQVDVPDIETGMAIVLMNVKGTDEHT